MSQPERLADYSALWNGSVLHEVLLQIDPEPPHQFSELDGLEDKALTVGRIKNFDCIVKNIKALYEEELGQTLLVVPECIVLAKSSDTREGLENMKLLILLLLGAAVQCPNKEIFITRIKELDLETQHGIVEHIKQVLFYSVHFRIRLSHKRHSNMLSLEKNAVFILIIVVLNVYFFLIDY